MFHICYHILPVCGIVLLPFSRLLCMMFFNKDTTLLVYFLDTFVRY